MPERAFDLITLGETMMRLSPPVPLRLGQSAALDVNFGGAESNVAANLAQLGRQVAWASRLPDNPLAHQLVNTLRGYGVNTDAVVWAEGERLGLYFIEAGAAPRGTRVWYDRAESAASRMQPDDFSPAWLASGAWLHLTGITPALSATCRAVMQHAITQAQAAHINIAFDVNYRALLWPPQQAAQTVEPFCHAANVVFIARRDAALLFQVSGADASDTAAQLQARWGGVVIVTDGDSGAAACDAHGQTVHVPSLPVQLVDRVGAGDAFASGVLHRLIESNDALNRDALTSGVLETALKYGAALAALKLTIAGDIARVTRDELRALVEQSGAALLR